MCNEYPQRTPVPAEYRQPATGGATQPQITYICDLLGKRNLFAWPDWFDATNAMDHEEYAAYLEHFKTVQVPAFTKKAASDCITFLRSLPYAPTPKPVAAVQRATGEMAPARGTVHQPSARIYVEYVEMTTDSGKKRVGQIVLPNGTKILAGSYGLDTSSESQFLNQTSFFKVWVGDRGGWDVRLYVSDDTRRVDLAFGTKIWALGKIADDPANARKLFGVEFKKCSNCGRGLTNDQSREDAEIDGLGPICRENVGRF